MYYLLYKTTNLSNGKIYVGCHKTVNIDDNYLGSGTLLFKAIAKYGKLMFKKDILSYYESEKEMYIAEKEMVNESFVRRDDTYNIRCGGRGGRMNEETRQRVSQKLIGVKKSIATRKKMSIAQTGSKKSLVTRAKIKQARAMHNPMSDETKKQIGLKSAIHQKGSSNSQFGSMWITNSKIAKKIKKTDPIPEGWEKGRMIL